MSEVVVMIVGIVGTVSSMVFGYIAFRKKENEEKSVRGKSKGILISEIGNIKNSIDRMYEKLDVIEKNYHEISRRVIRVETSIRGGIEK